MIVNPRHANRCSTLVETVYSMKARLRHHASHCHSTAMMARPPAIRSATRCTSSIFIAVCQLQVQSLPLNSCPFPSSAAGLLLPFDSISPHSFHLLAEKKFDLLIQTLPSLISSRPFDAPTPTHTIIKYALHDITFISGAVRHRLRNGYCRRSHCSCQPQRHHS